jgi:Transposase DDE domain
LATCVGAGHYRPKDFDYDPQAGTCVCPAGRRLYQNGAKCHHNSQIGTKFQEALRDCLPCTLREKCLRKPDITKIRQVCFFRGKAAGGKVSYTAIMKRAIDSERGRQLYGRRFATVEPVLDEAATRRKYPSRSHELLCTNTPSLVRE